MDASSWIALGTGAVAAIVWLVRLEGKTNQKADASTVQALDGRTTALEAVTANQAAALKAAVDGHASTTIEVVRLQEQIKHLTDLIERYFVPATPARRGRSGSGD